MQQHHYSTEPDRARCFDVPISWRFRPPFRNVVKLSKAREGAARSIAFFVDSSPYDSPGLRPSYDDDVESRPPMFGQAASIPDFKSSDGPGCTDQSMLEASRHHSYGSPSIAYQPYLRIERKHMFQPHLEEFDAPFLHNWADRPIEISVVVPTLNELPNICPFIARLSVALANLSWELVFVDDNSTDGTADLVRTLARCDRRVRVVQRIHQRGLSSAVIAGALSTSAPVIAVIDADMQHDERLISSLYKMVAEEGYDVAVGSRYIAGGTVSKWAESRAAISKVATRIASLVLRTPLSDPMSGFFVVSRDALMRAIPRMSAIGFKILTDLVASSPTPLKICELPYVFGLRSAGESKLDSKVACEYLLLLMDKTIGRYAPVRFLMFAMIGAFGLVVHLGTLSAGLNVIGFSFVVAQTLAVVTAMTVNFGLNNALTYRDRRLKGWKLLTGLLSFYAVCLIGAAANIGVGTWIYRSDQPWVLAGIAGAIVGAVWNYAASSALTWQR